VLDPEYVGMAAYHGRDGDAPVPPFASDREITVLVVSIKKFSPDNVTCMFGVVRVCGGVSTVLTAKEVQLVTIRIFSGASVFISSFQLIPVTIHLSLSV
jgi:hypothetical protein